MATLIKSSFLLKAFMSIAFLVVIVCVNISSASSKLEMNPNPSPTMDTHYFEQIKPNGDLLGKIDPPPDITKIKIIPFKDDRSCGSAALATILRHSFKVDVNEMDVITGLLTYGDRKSIVKRAAFSFYDMKHFLGAIGYTGTGYTINGQVSYEQFNKDDFKTIRNTTIIPIKINGYSHFTVYRAFNDRYVYLGSPLYGNICLTFNDFSKVIIKKSFFVISEH